MQDPSQNEFIFALIHFLIDRGTQRQIMHFHVEPDSKRRFLRVEKGFLVFLKPTNAMRKYYIEIK